MGVAEGPRARRHIICEIYLTLTPFSLLFAFRVRLSFRFTKYLTIISRLSYDNVKDTIDLRRTSNLLNVLGRAQGFFGYNSFAKS